MWCPFERVSWLEERTKIGAPASPRPSSNKYVPARTFCARTQEAGPGVKFLSFVVTPIPLIHHGPYSEVHYAVRLAWNMWRTSGSVIVQLHTVVESLTVLNIHFSLSSFGCHFPVFSHMKPAAAATGSSDQPPLLPVDNVANGRWISSSCGTNSNSCCRHT